MNLKDNAKKTISPDDVRKAIYIIDSYRADLYYDISSIDKHVKEGKLGRPFASIWKDLKDKMIKMASVTNSIPGVMRLARLQSISENMMQIAIPIIVLVFLIGLMAPGTIPVTTSGALYLNAAAVILIISGMSARSYLGRRIGMKIEKYLANNPEANKLKRQEAKKAAQLLIEELRIYLLETGKEPKKNLIGVSYLDYDDIKMVGKPRPWRKYYLAQIVV